MDKVVSVSGLNLYVKSLLEGDKNLIDITVEGEISGFINHYKSGHWYFTLKDEKAAIKAAMFGAYNRKLNFVPENGMKVIVRGRVSIYERDGAYQFYVTDMFQSGIGLQHLAFERLKEKLGKEGLFDESRKKSLPTYPFTVGIATSATGAALQDIISTTSRRFPCAKLVLAACGVQGESSKPSIIAAIKALDNRDDVEVIIIARGGGSKEDLWVFNDEDIARTAAACTKPTVSAIGHEIDWSILDYVCDIRAATPTAAAEIVFPDINEIQYRLMKFDEKISQGIKDNIQGYIRTLEYIKNSKGFNNIKILCDQSSDNLVYYRKLLNSAVNQKINTETQRLRYISENIENNNPLATLKKGYSLIFKNDEMVKAEQKLKKNDKIMVRTHIQELTCTVDVTRTIKR